MVHGVRVRVCYTWCKDKGYIVVWVCGVCRSMCCEGAL